MKIVWLMVAASCGVVAAAFLWRGNSDTAFVLAVIGTIAWFLNFRTQARASTAARDAEQENQARDLDND